jgi:hypothetical protein
MQLLEHSTSQPDGIEKVELNAVADSIGLNKAWSAATPFGQLKLGHRQSDRPKASSSKASPTSSPFAKRRPANDAVGFNRREDHLCATSLQ